MKIGAQKFGFQLQTLLPLFSLIVHPKYWIITCMQLAIDQFVFCCCYYSRFSFDNLKRMLCQVKSAKAIVILVGRSVCHLVWLKNLLILSNLIILDIVTTKSLGTNITTQCATTLGQPQTTTKSGHQTEKRFNLDNRIRLT